MGATVTCNKKVGAFTLLDKIYYLLFEETYEKNCYPHTPNWCAIAFGTIDQVMKSIFSHASSCEGGGLQGRSGQILSENYIASWLAELANPIHFSPERSVCLKFGESIYSLTSEPEMRASIIQALREMDDDETASALEAGNNVYRSLTSPSVLKILDLGVSPWRLGIKYEANAPANDLGYQPVPSKKMVDIDQYAKLPCQGSELFVNRDGHWSECHHSYVWTEQFVENLWSHELKHPGSYKALIKAQRNQMEHAKAFAGSSIVVFDFNERYQLLEDYNKRSLDKFMAAIGVSGPGRFRLDAITEHLSHEHESVYLFHRFVYHGIIHIETPDPISDLAPVYVEPPLVVPAPAYGIVVNFGSVDYKLLRPAGPRKGWLVERISDNQHFRMSSCHLNDALRDLAIKAKRTAVAAATQIQSIQASQMQTALF